MPNLSAAKKSLRADQRKRVYNLRRARAMRDHTKEIMELVKKGKLAEAVKLLPAAYKAIDKAVKRGVLKKNTAARKKSSLAKAVRKTTAAK